MGERGVAAQHRGRPRSPQADRAIHDAVLALLHEHGFDEISIEGVAEYAHVAKTTIYRRYRSKPSLVAHTLLDEAAAATPIPDSGSLREDLLILMRSRAELLSRPYWVRTLPALAAAAADDPEVNEVMHRDALARLARAEILYDRARERGEIPDGVIGRDLDELLSGAIQTRVLLLREPPDDNFIERIVDVVLRGVGARVRFER